LQLLIGYRADSSFSRSRGVLNRYIAMENTQCGMDTSTERAENGVKTGQPAAIEETYNPQE
jgi:hypothetical protein